MPVLVPAGPRIPCRRCQQISLTCSFETEPAVAPALDVSPSALAQRVVDLEARLGLYEDRVAHLEACSQGTRVEHSLDVTDELDPPERSISFADQNSVQHHEDTSGLASRIMPFSMDNLDLGPPIDTLRSLRDGYERHCHENVAAPTAAVPANPPWTSSANGNALSLNLLDDSDVRQMVAVYFEHCHQMAPLLDISLCHETSEMGRNRPTLLLALCCVGARFWKAVGLPFKSGHTPHPKLAALTAMLDAAISRLLLRPTTADVHIDSVRVLLLQTGHLAVQDRPYRSRYSDISAWSCLGLALRYANILRLDGAAVAPFRASQPRAHREDMSRMRVLQNLITCDWNLMLSSGFPMTSEPDLASEIGPLFAAQATAQSPGDLRVTALVELVVLSRNATRMSSDSSGRQLDMFYLRKLNTEMDIWERHWLPRLRHTEYQHSSLPFTSLRWCRLALNSAHLKPVLSTSMGPNAGPTPLDLSTLQCLEICVDAALQILLSLSGAGSDLSNATKAPYKPSEPLVLDKSTVQRLAYAVDSAWISHTFAIAFLVLAYIRGAVDEDLNICPLTPPAQQARAPAQPRPEALLSRVARLALDAFRMVSESFTCHPVHGYLPAVENAVGLMFKHDTGPQAGGEAADEGLFDFMIETGMDWPTNFHGGDAGWPDPTLF
ncbi:hypothetical protein LTR53_014222 [Teratosphaeriaceae sp. CCFEE 6253]|nr:hypothetical protein LTR53_014222 [Teratosphaeriaceae sp. CCFEE 6253]